MTLQAYPEILSPKMNTVSILRGHFGHKKKSLAINSLPSEVILQSKDNVTFIKAFSVFNYFLAINWYNFKNSYYNCKSESSASKVLVLLYKIFEILSKFACCL